MQSLFTLNNSRLGEFSLHTFDIDQHSQHLLQWVNQPHATYWGMQGFNLEQVKQNQRQLAGERVEQFLGCHNGKPCFLLEVYRPQTTELSQHITLNDGDVGMHILIAQPEQKAIPGFTLAVFDCLMQFLFDTHGAQRVIVEPDAGNHKVHALNRAVGFFHRDRVYLEQANKTALLGVCDRHTFYRTKALRESAPKSAAITPNTADWKKVNRLLVCKAIAEFSHERLLTPTPCEHGWQLESSDVRYTFNAEILALDHWLIDEGSLQKSCNGIQQTPDAVEFIQEFQPALGITDALLPTYLEEIASTVTGLLWKHQHPVASSRDLVSADFQTLEQAMIEGHPCFIANSGKIGFDSEDFSRYAPESGQPVKLVWLAVHKSRAEFHCVDAFDYETHLRCELDYSLRLGFERELRNRGLSPTDYWLMPVHPWQWQNMLQRLFASEIAQHRLVYLGEGSDTYAAQQSIRTFFNRSRPDQSYVKVALSIVNMGFMRGLSSKYMSVTPAINQWVAGVFEQDHYLKHQGMSILREYAAIGYRHPHFDRGVMQTSPYNKMLAALWRDNPLCQIKDGQQAMTMAALLHVDRDGVALLPEIISASGLRIEDWLTRYFDIYLKPLLHCFYAHHMVFMPHGENLILVLDNHIPVASFIKDIGEEVCLLNSDQSLPDSVARISVQVPHEVELLSIFTDVFDCFFRFVSAILHKHSGFSDQQFWAIVGQSIRDYQASQPQLAARFAEHDIFQSQFLLSCLNRLQLRNNKQMVDLLDPAAALQFAGKLQNPVANSRNALRATG